MIYLQLFYSFFMTGLFAIGGGLATLPFLYDLSDTTGWFTHAEIANMLAISESTPGALGINMATYAGFEVASVPGGVIATLGLITPGIIIILLIAKVLEKFKQNCWVQWGLYGLRAASIALICSAALSVVQISLIHFQIIGEGGFRFADLFDFKAIFFAVLLFLAMRKWNRIHPIVFIAISAVVGVVFRFAGV